MKSCHPLVEKYSTHKVKFSVGTIPVFNYSKLEFDEFGYAFTFTEIGAIFRNK